MTVEAYTTLAEVGNKELSSWIYFGIGWFIAFPFGMGLFAIKDKSYILGLISVLALLGIALPLGVHNYLGFVYYMNWKTEDPSFERLLAGELGSNYAWKVRGCVWAGEITSLVWPYVAFCNPWTRRLFARWSNRCLCGYSLEGLTTNTCPECGRTLKNPCTSLPPSA